MYGRALSLFKTNIALYTIVIVVVVMFELMMQAVGIVTLVFAGLTMLYTHRMIQLDEVYGWADPLSTTGKDGSKVPIIGYSLRFLALFIILTLMITAGFITLDRFGVLDPNAETVDLAFAIWGVLIAVPAFCGLMAVVGTVLPACAERGDTSLISAAGRGFKTFWKTLVNLVIGPVALAITGMIILGYTGWHVDETSGWVLRAAYQIFVSILTIVPATLAATALSIAYLDAESR